MIHYVLRLSLVAPLLCFAISCHCAAAATCHSVVLFLFLIPLTHTCDDDLQRPNFGMKTRISKYGIMLVMDGIQMRNCTVRGICLEDMKR